MVTGGPSQRDVNSAAIAKSVATVVTEVLKEREKKYKEAGHGCLTNIDNEGEFFDVARKSEKVLCHFYTTTNRRCDIVDAKLKELSIKRLDIRCIRIDAERSPFLSERLKIFMIPSIMIIKNGKTDHTIQGFDELGGTDNWTLRDLEDVLYRHGFVQERVKASGHDNDNGELGIMTRRKMYNEESDDSD